MSAAVGEVLQESKGLQMLHNTEKHCEKVWKRLAQLLS